MENWNNFHFDPPPPSSVVFRKWPSETTTGRVVEIRLNPYTGRSRWR